VNLKILQGILEFIEGQSKMIFVTTSEAKNVLRENLKSVDPNFRSLHMAIKAKVCGCRWFL